MLMQCLKLSSSLVGNTRDTSAMYEKAIFFFNATAKNEIQICSYVHETCLVLISSSILVGCLNILERS